MGDGTAAPTTPGCMCMPPGGVVVVNGDGVRGLSWGENIGDTVLDMPSGDTISCPLPCGVQPTSIGSCILQAHNGQSHQGTLLASHNISLSSSYVSDMLHKHCRCQQISLKLFSPAECIIPPILHSIVFIR